MITAIVLTTIGFILSIKHWFWSGLFFTLALTATIAFGGIMCIFTLPVMVWCGLMFMGQTFGAIEAKRRNRETKGKRI